MTEEDSFKPIYIIGNTPLADFLSAKLSLAGENIYRLGTHNSNPTQTYTLKELSNGQKHSVCIPSGNIMHHPAKMTILCLNPNTQRADLAYFSAAKAEATPIISFCHTNSDTLSKFIRCPVIPAYFNGWINIENKDTITFIGAPKGITLSISEQHPLFEDIRQVLAKTYLDLHFSEDNQQNFWEAFIPEIISGLFTLDSHAHYKDIAKKNGLRQTLNDLVNEITAVIPANIKVEKDKVITDIYALPDNYIPPLISDLRHKNKGELSFSLSVLQKQPLFNSKNCPLTFKILRKQLQSFFSAVEE